MDFEATCERDDRRWPHEIIEFPAQLIDCKTLQVVDEFREFVRPTEKPQLTAFCTELTGIKQKDLVTADTLDVVLKRFQQWLSGHVGHDPGAALPVTCGDWDLERMLPGEARRKHLQYPAALKGWCNIKQPFEELMGHSGKGMAHMLQALCLKLIGHHHSGIDDTRNIGRILVELVQRFGQQLTWTSGRFPEHAQVPTLASKEVTIRNPARAMTRAQKEVVQPQVPVGGRNSRWRRQDPVRAETEPEDLAEDANAGSRRGLDSRLSTSAAANRTARSDSTPNVAKRAAGDDSAKLAVRRLMKKLQQMEVLELKQKDGCVLCDDQLQKLARLPEVRSQLAELTAPVPDAWD